MPPTTPSARVGARARSFTPPPDWDAGFEFSGRGAPGMNAGEFSDFFAELFGRAGAGAHRRAAGSRLEMRGQDHHAKIVLDLEDAWRGATRQVTLRSRRGRWAGPGLAAAAHAGREDSARREAGQLIRLAGQGGPGQGGAPAGDLFLEVHFKPHPRFRIDGAHLVADLPVAPWEAALGAVVPVELPDGSSLKVRVPAGAQSGRELSVRGKGLPGATPGNLELVVRVVLPSAFDPRARKLYEQMAAELSDFDARKVAAADAARGE